MIGSPMKRAAYEAALDFLADRYASASDDQFWFACELLAHVSNLAETEPPYEADYVARDVEQRLRERAHAARIADLRAAVA